MCRNMFNKEMLGKMKKGAFLVNTARGGICERDAIVEALESGQLGGEPSSLALQLLSVQKQHLALNLQQSTMSKTDSCIYTVAPLQSL